MPSLDLPRHYNAATHFIDRHLQEGRADKAAYIDAEGTHSYRSLAARVNQAARVLAGHGVRPEQRVMMGMLDSIDFVAVFFGALKLGAVPVPVNTLLTADDYTYLLSDSRATALVASAALWPRWSVAARSQPSLQKVFVVGEVEGGAHLDSVEVVDLGAARAAADSSPVPVADTTPDDPAFWLYSSGSTGAPKGAIHLMGDLAHTAVLYGESVLQIEATDRVYSAAKLFFAYGLGNAMTFPLHVGATAILLADRPTPEAVAQIFETHSPTIFYGVPTLYGAMLADDRPLATDQLRRCVSAGEALPEDLLTRWQRRTGVEILDGLGSTEMLHIFLSNRPGDVRPGCSGRAVPGYTLDIRDDAGRSLGAEELGELWVSGPTSATAYWNQRQRSLQTFHGPWTRTGDKYTCDAEGYYRYAGRSDDMMKVGGIWVSPFEVEAALVAHPDVLEAAVVGREDDTGLIKPHAHVVLRSGTAMVAGDEAVGMLQQFVKDRLAPYKYPRWISFAAELPKTATGKVQRFKLRQP